VILYSPAHAGDCCCTRTIQRRTFWYPTYKKKHVLIAYVPKRNMFWFATHRHTQAILVALMNYLEIKRFFITLQIKRTWNEKSSVSLQIQQNYSDSVRTKEKRVLSRYTHAGNTCCSYEPSCCLRQGAAFTQNARTHT
jgi:hypothetical protein